jgi:hypothetical protein
MKSADKIMLDRRKTFLRKTYGPVTERGASRIESNNELEELYKIPYLEADIKRESCERSVQVIRMDRTVVNKKEKGIRKV